MFPILTNYDPFMSYYRRPRYLFPDLMHNEFLNFNYDDFLKEDITKQNSENTQNEKENKNESIEFTNTSTFIIDKNGKKIKYDKKEYKDNNTGRHKMIQHREIDGKKRSIQWERKDKSSKYEKHNVDNLKSENEIEDFELLWKDTPLGKSLQTIEEDKSI